MGAKFYKTALLSLCQIEVARIAGGAGVANYVIGQDNAWPRTAAATQAMCADPSPNFPLEKGRPSTGSGVNVLDSH